MDAVQIVTDCLKQLNEVWEKSQFNEITPDTFIYGKLGAIDSMELIALLSDIEGRISDEHDINIVIADERALSETRSPFKTVQSLAAFIDLLVLHKQDLNG